MCAVFICFGIWASGGQFTGRAWLLGSGGGLGRKWFFLCTFMQSLKRGEVPVHSVQCLVLQLYGLILTFWRSWPRIKGRTVLRSGGPPRPRNAKRICCRVLGTEQLQYLLTGFVVLSVSRLCAGAAAMGPYIIAQRHYEPSGVASTEVLTH